MAFNLSLLKALLEVALLAFLAQGVVALFNWPRRHRNPVYQLLGIVLRPALALVRWGVPRHVLDRHIPIATFILLTAAWLVVGLWRIHICHNDLNQPACRAIAVQQKSAA